MKLSEIRRRVLRKNECAFLKEMTYQSVFVPENVPAVPKDIVDLPQLSKYFENWRRTGDYCLVAECQGEKIGAVWCRLFNAKNKGFGFVSENIPELSIAVDKSYRDKGIGSILLDAFFKHLKKAGFHSLSLSVDRRNPAVNLYIRTGFKIIKTNENDYIMLKKL